MIPEETGQNWFGKHAVYGSDFLEYSPDEWTHIHYEENAGDTWFWASIYAWTRRKPRFLLQLSTDHVWLVKIENICCQSQYVRLRTRCIGEKPVNCVPAPDGLYWVPMEKTIEVDRASLGADWFHQSDGTVNHGERGWRKGVTRQEASGGIVVSIECLDDIGSFE